MIDEIIGMLEENRDLEQAEKMSAYMQNRFEFAGIPKPKYFASSFPISCPFVIGFTQECINKAFDNSKLFSLFIVSIMF